MYSNNGKRSDSKMVIHDYYGFSLIKNRFFKKGMGLGSADGKEFLSIKNKIEEITIVEIAEEFYKTNLQGTPCKYVKPNITGRLDFPNEYFDLIIISSVLHHIPNVTYVWNEITRCLKPKGILIVNEPITYMGGFEGERKGITLRERGIPLSFFEKNVRDFRILRFQRFNHVITRKVLAPILKKNMTESLTLLKVDKVLCNIFHRKDLYYSKHNIEKLFTASSIYMVLEKK